MSVVDDNTKSSLGIVLSAIPGRSYSVRNIPLKVTFVNTAGEEIRLLRHFEPLPVFFAFEMVGQRGNYVPIPGAGKIDFYEGSITYETLSPGETFQIEVDLADIVAYPEEMESGEYAISTTYHNQYGENCLRGQVSSNTIHVTILSTPESHP